MLENITPSIEPCGKLFLFSFQELYSNPILVLCIRSQLHRHHLLKRWSISFPCEYCKFFINSYYEEYQQTTGLFLEIGPLK